MKSKIVYFTTPIDGLKIIKSAYYKDNRGGFFENYNERDYFNIGIKESFVQDNFSFSKVNVLRGLHFQKNHPQSKLITVIKGKVYDVAVDLRLNSSTYGQWYGTVLDDINRNQMYIPKGFAHGFLVLENDTIFHYKCSDFYNPEDEGGIIWNDSNLCIDWPISITPILAEKDANYSTLEKIQYMYSENNE